MKHALFSLALFGLVGCASMQSPPTDAIAKIPIVRVGGQAPLDTEYVVCYLAGFAFPVELRASGSLFVSEKKIESQVALAKDLYIYKYWASHDGKSWKRSHELPGVECGGGFDVNGLQANVELEAR